MAIVSLVFALFTVGYVLGVWTACLVFRQSQTEYEEGAPWQVAGRSQVPVADRELALVRVSPVAERA